MRERGPVRRERAGGRNRASLIRMVSIPRRAHRDPSMWSRQLCGWRADPPAEYRRNRREGRCTCCKQHSNHRSSAWKPLGGSSGYHSRVDDVHDDAGFQRCASNGVIWVQGRAAQDDVADSEGSDPDPLVWAGILDTEHPVYPSRDESGCDTPNDSPYAYDSENAMFRCFSTRHDRSTFHWNWLAHAADNVPATRPISSGFNMPTCASDVAAQEGRVLRRTALRIQVDPALSVDAVPAMHVLSSVMRIGRPSGCSIRSRLPSAGPDTRIRVSPQWAATHPRPGRASPGHRTRESSHEAADRVRH